MRETIREAHEASLRRRFAVLDDTEREHLDTLLDLLRAGLYEEIEE